MNLRRVVLTCLVPRPGPATRIREVGEGGGEGRGVHKQLVVESSNTEANKMDYLHS